MPFFVFEPMLDLAVANFLLNVDGQEVGRDVLVDLDTKCLSDSKTSRTSQNKNDAFPPLLPPSKPAITSEEKEGVFCLSFSTTGRSINSAFHFRG